MLTGSDGRWNASSLLPLLELSAPPRVPSKIARVKEGNGEGELC